MRFSVTSLFAVTTVSALALWWFGPARPIVPASDLREQLAVENRGWPAGLREVELMCSCWGPMCTFDGSNGERCIYPEARGMGAVVFVEEDLWIGEPKPIVFAIPAGAVLVPAPLGSGFLLDVAIGVTMMCLGYWCLRLG